MSWLAILQLSVTLLQQALSAFAQGQKKEATAFVSLAPQHVETIQQLAEEHK